MEQVAVLVDLPADRDPRRMELCSDHAASMTVPMGWTRDDQREPDEVDAPRGPPTVAEIASLSTLDVIAAALEPAGTNDEAAATDESSSADDDGPSVAAVMAAALANPEGLGARDPAEPVEPAGGPDGETVAEVDASQAEDVTAGAQLSLAPDQSPVRRARPVPAALDGDTQEPAPREDLA